MREGTTQLYPVALGTGSTEYVAGTSVPRNSQTIEGPAIAPRTGRVFPTTFVRVMDSPAQLGNISTPIAPVTKARLNIITTVLVPCPDTSVVWAGTVQ